MTTPRTALTSTLFALCASTLAAQETALKLHTLPENWFTTRQDHENVDSPTVWHPHDDSRPPLLMVTGKESHSVNIFDARNGYFLQRIGGLGVELGQFNRPNGAWVIDDLLFVVERDNHRVQLLSLPDCKALTSFGDADLIKPYGLCVLPDGDGKYTVYVTDNYEDASGEQVPQAQMGRRVRAYEVEVEGPSAEGELIRTFGDIAGNGVLNIVESIYADPAHNRLMIGDEDMDTPGGQNIKVYTLDGTFTGQTVGDGVFKFQPEGIALYEQGEGAGMWVFTDQGKTGNFFHFYDRETLAYIGSIEGVYTLNTDGIWLDQTATTTFPKGVLYAVDNDACVAAIDMRKILTALGR